MASTKATRRAKRESYGKVHGHDSDNGSVIMKGRKAHKSKEALTGGAAEKAVVNGKSNREYVLKKRNKPMARNGRQPGRQLIRWNASTDQILLLIMEYELKRHGISIPFDAVAKRLAAEKDTTGACVQQHLTKLRKEMLARGSWVPPLPGKQISKQPDNIRGVVMVKKRNGESELKEVSWTEDVFKYVDLVHINKANMSKSIKHSDDGGDHSGPAHRQLKSVRSSMSSSEDDVDPEKLRSDDEFDPDSHEGKYVKKSARASAKVDKKSKRNVHTGESDDESESDSGNVVKREGLRKPVMMALYQSEAEEEVRRRIVVLRVSTDVLSMFPEGVSDDYVNAQAGQRGSTDAEGEEASEDDVWTAENYQAAFGSNEGYSVMDANTSENYQAAFGGDDDYSMMDANTAQNYHTAFGNQGYSIMDANTSENYLAAFGAGNGGNSRAHEDDDEEEVANEDEEDSNDSDFEEQQNQSTQSGLNPGNFQTSHQVTSVSNPSQNENVSTPRQQVPLTGGPVHRAANEPSYDGLTAAEAWDLQQAYLSGANNGEIVGQQNTAGNNVGFFNDLDDNPVDSLGASAANNADFAPELNDGVAPYVSGFDFDLDLFNLDPMFGGGYSFE